MFRDDKKQKEKWGLPNSDQHPDISKYFNSEKKALEK